jgi:hypothetical protein
LVPFFILLDRFEGRNRAGSGLFFILKNYAYPVKILPNKESWNCYHPEDFWNVASNTRTTLEQGILHRENVWNAMCQHTHYSTREYGILESLPSGGSLERDVPTHALLGINGESAGNYHLMIEESTGGRGFRWELPAHR